eukprot:PhF_6_TR19085/c0_g1_i1/m.28069
MRRNALGNLLTNGRVWLIGFFCIQVLYILSPEGNSNNSNGFHLLQGRGYGSVINHTNIRRLILVPCHATLQLVPTGDTQQEGLWLLEPHLRGGHIIDMITLHIKKALELAVEDEEALVLFSGGQTKRGSTWSEGASYLQHAVRNNWWGMGDKVSTRVYAEEDARDSFENLLFAVCRFAQLTRGRYPTKITVVGMKYKEHRFVSLHREALKMPMTYMTYVGVDYKEETLSDKRSVAVFTQDPFGCSGNRILRGDRNPTNRGTQYYDPQSCPRLLPLIRYCVDSYPNELTTNVVHDLPWNKE